MKRQNPAWVVVTHFAERPADVHIFDVRILKDKRDRTIFLMLTGISTNRTTAERMHQAQQQALQFSHADGGFVDVGPERLPAG